MRLRCGGNTHTCMIKKIRRRDKNTCNQISTRKRDIASLKNLCGRSQSHPEHTLYTHSVPNSHHIRARHPFTERDSIKTDLRVGFMKTVRFSGQYFTDGGPFFFLFFLTRARYLQSFFLFSFFRSTEFAGADQPFPRQNRDGRCAAPRRADRNNARSTPRRVPAVMFDNRIIQSNQISRSVTLARAQPRIFARNRLWIFLSRSERGTRFSMLIVCHEFLSCISVTLLSRLLNDNK